MPFKSKAQARACFAKHEVSWNCARWTQETPGGIKALPERAKGSGSTRYHLSQVRKDAAPRKKR